MPRYRGGNSGLVEIALALPSCSTYVPIMDDSRREAEQAVAAYFHTKRAERKKAAKDKPKSDAPMHHRANTDWWNSVDR